MTMLEKAKKALFFEIYHHIPEGERECAWEEVRLSTRVDFGAYIRAVLSAIREPDEAMLKAGEDAAMNSTAPPIDASGIVVAIWQAPIDVILAEKP